MNGNAADTTTKPVVKAGLAAAAALAAKLELDALSKVLEFQVNYKTFPTKGPSSDVVTLVTLKTNPPKFCHGSGKTVEESQNDAASHALLLMSGDAGGSDGTAGSDGAAAD